MINFTFNTPIDIDSGESVSDLVCIMEEYRVHQTIQTLGGTAQIHWYRTMENAIDRFNEVWPIEVPRVLRNMSSILSATQFANVDVEQVYNAIVGILEDGDSAGQWQASWGSWDGLKGLDALNDGVVDMPAVPDAAPTTLVATANGVDAIDLTWAESVGNEFGFVVERSLTTTTGFVEVARPTYNAVAWSDSNLEADTEYFYRVAAWNWAGLSAYSAEDSATTDAS